MHNKKNLNTTRLIVVGFIVIISVGSLLLFLPFSSRSGQSTDFLSALFTATSATCVTGLVVVDTYQHWTIFGQAVILVLIQIGGLGFMTIVSLFSFLLHRQIGLRQRLAMVQSLSLNELNGVVRMVKHVLIGTFLLEFTGAVILSLCFIPDFGLAGGIWRGVFHSVSAFCNAGFDLMGCRGAYVGLTVYAHNPVVNFTIMCLIVIGGLGFFVWEDIIRNLRFRKLRTYTKLVLLITGVLIICGAALIFLIEQSNPATMGGMGTGNKIMASLFQSITARTAGFNTMNQNGMYEATKIITVFLMFIGGSSGSTAGGIKTVTLGVLILGVLTVLRGKDQVSVFGRSISTSKVFSAMAIVSLAFILCLTGATMITMIEGLPFIDTLFEAVSAFGTVGLSAGITPSLAVSSRIVLIILMFLGRIGVMTFSIALMMRSSYTAKIKYPKSDVLIG